MSAKAAQRVKTIVDELLSTRVADLGETGQTKKRLEELESSLAEVQSFAASLGSLLGGYQAPVRRNGAAATSTATKAVKAAKRGRPRGRPGHGRGEFSATPFILEAVRGAGSTGIRPREIVEQVVAAAPGQHVRPSALVSTILTRLKRRGEVKRRTGRWYSK